ncbi:MULTISPECIES: isoprenylcysteine carboxylmethyltransferase family protein [unclassified Mesorhizobium]|uniref:methyltransferase family protein n=2 Tax=Mesorhizobium TaxID=68287 RepID=UPI001FDEADA5|nr:MULTISPECIES: isoprenylcysteine carboxylmethyltransferase family protein [unclassified Mesorhizobium]
MAEDLNKSYGSRKAFCPGHLGRESQEPGQPAGGTIDTEATSISIPTTILQPSTGHFVNGDTGRLRVELLDPTKTPPSRRLNNEIPNVLIRAEMPILAFEAEGGGSSKTSAFSLPRRRSNDRYPSCSTARPAKPGKRRRAAYRGVRSKCGAQKRGPSFKGASMRVQPVNQRMRINAARAAGLVAATVILFSHPGLGGRVHELIQMAGLGLVLTCFIGRMWSILYIGSKKNLELITSGPYSLTRNPLYLFSTLGAAGIGLIHGSIAVALALGFFSYWILVITAAKEAEHLKTIFGSQYDSYARCTPLFWPKLSQYTDSAEVVFSPKALKRNFQDGLYFPAAYPAIEAIEQLRAGSYLPILMTIY